MAVTVELSDRTAERREHSWRRASGVSAVRQTPNLWSHSRIDWPLVRKRRLRLRLRVLAILLLLCIVRGPSLLLLLLAVLELRRIRWLLRLRLQLHVAHHRPGRTCHSARHRRRSSARSVAP